MRNALVWVMLLAVLGGCSPVQDLTDVNADITTFHQQLDASQFDAIYAGADPALKTAAQHGEFQHLLAAVHRKLGPFVSGSSISWNDNLIPDGHFMTVHYTAKYGRGPADETFVYRIGGPHPALAGYHISSNTLIIN